jgi:hypothetical protein
LLIPGGDIEDATAITLSQNGTYQGYLRASLDFVQEIATDSMNGPDKAMNLAIFNAGGFLMNGHQAGVLQNSYHPRKVCQ